MLIFKIFKLGPLRDQQKNKLVSKVFIDLVKVKYPACVLLQVKKYFKCILVVGLHFYECMYRGKYTCDPPHPVKTSLLFL
jgi:hypothetical protein